MFLWVFCIKGANHFQRSSWRVFFFFFGYTGHLRPSIIIVASGSIPLIKDWTWAPCIGSVES